MWMSHRLEGVYYKRLSYYKRLEHLVYSQTYEILDLNSDGYTPWRLSKVSYAGGIGHSVHHFQFEIILKL